ncbi:MAG TPA: SDR family oxidoreductase [Acidimicrobiales bacterium]|nr:SDR family oxidoreductase [Acidimicrobiales bacterium]
MDLGLSGKRALVTGGSRGIGKQVARQLGAEGADVAIAARDRARLDAAAAELSSASAGRVVAVTVDTRLDDSVREMVARVAAELGGVDILVNCAAQPAGQAPAPRYDEVRADYLLDEMDTKVMGYLRCVQAVVPLMIEQGWGRIVNLSGLAARRTGALVGSARNVVVAALTVNLAAELAPYGIGVNVVHPGLTRTEATTPEREAAAGSNYLGRMVDAEEVAWVVAFLCSPRSVAIDGDTIAVGGGSPGVIYC